MTLSGQLDYSLEKNPGSALAAQDETHGSRVRLVGSEDLGGGLKANFNLEHRMTLKDGAANATFWNGTSTVGLSGAFGSVDFGRQYTAGFLSANNKADPFGGDGAGALRSVGMRTQTSNGMLRVASAVGYKNSMGPVSLHVTFGEEAAATTATQRNFGFAVGYTAGDLSVGGGKDTNEAGNELTNLYATYNLNGVTLAAGYGKTGGTLATTKGYLLAASMPLGAGVVKAGYATAENAAGTTTNNKFGIGYSYNLSKRTRVDLTAGNDSKLTANKSGYDVTLTHAF